MNWLLDFLVGTENTAEILNLKFIFNFGFESWFVMLVVLGLGVYSYIIYKKEAVDAGKVIRNFLALMRWLTYILFILIILQPRLLIERMVEPRNVVAVLLDTSQSMSFEEKGADEEYIQSVAKVLNGDGIKAPSLDASARERIRTIKRSELVEGILKNPKLNLLKRLEEKFSLRFFSFDKSLNEILIRDEKNKDDLESLSIPEPLGELTQLGSSLMNCLRRVEGFPVAGVVVFSDGRNNKGQDPLVVANHLGLVGAPIFPVGIGLPGAVDVKIVSVSIPELIFKGDEIAVEVTFEAESLEGSRLPIEMKINGKVVGKGKVLAKEGSFKQNVVIQAEEVGDFTFEVSVPPQPDEFFVENNVMKKQVRVIDDAIRVLIAVEHPSWEYRYLKGMLDRDKRVEAKVFIRSGDFRRSKIDKNFLSSFPVDDLDKDYDCIIINNLEASYFSQKQMQSISDYISKKGGSLIMISAPLGTPASYIGTPIGDLLPVRLKPVGGAKYLDFDTRFTRGFGLNLTREGRFNNMTRLTPLPEENVEVWTKLPKQYWYYTGIKRLKPSAVALMEHSWDKNEHGPIPLLALSRFGKGEVLFFGFNSIWRWRYKIGDRYTSRFWGQTIQRMGLPHLLGNSKRVNIETEGKEFTIGEKIDVLAKVLTQDFVPIRDGQITLVAIEKTKSLREEFVIGTDPTREGYFRGDIFLKEGLWDVVVLGHEKEETRVLSVEPARFEFDKPSLDKKGLESMAEASGGAYISFDDLVNLPEKMMTKVKKSKSTTEKDIWDTWLSLILVCLTTAIEWAFRKKVSLP